MNDSIPTSEVAISRVLEAYKLMFVADSLAMPVHWFYNPGDIQTAFPGGVKTLHPAPDFHPSSIMSLHSTSHGGRGSQHESNSKPQIVGDVILKGKRRYWGIPNMHYHQQMKAGENTLNSHCARLLMRTMANNKNHYNSDAFLDNYIRFMTADPPEHPDTYAESYHRGFFANLQAGRPKNQCAAITHDTPSIGSLVTIAPIVFTERLHGTSLSEVQELCREHLFLTHPDNDLARVCASYVDLLDKLLFRDVGDVPAKIIAQTAKISVGLDLPSLAKKATSDMQIVGGMFSSACYISDSWPSVLYLAYQYHQNPREGIIANANLGGDNVHRGSVLGAILGLITKGTVDDLYVQLADHEQINSEIEALFKKS
jgi:ADP-ribosylglycohydrolase